MEQPPISSTSSQPQTSKMAIWSLVLGLFSLIPCFGIIFVIPAVMLGHKARARIKNSDGMVQGSGLALGGLITGYLGIFLSLIALAVGIVVGLPAIAKAKTAAQTVLCVNNLRAIDFAKEQWAQENQKQPTDVPKPEDLNALMDKPFNTLTCPAGGKYSINSVGEKATCSVPGHKLE